MPIFEAESPFPNSQQLGIGLCPEPHKFTQYIHILFLYK
jgi:hypothetical protein